MKYSHIVALFLLAFSFALNTPVEAQTIEAHAVITMNDGQERIFYLQDDDQFAFEGQDRLLITNQGVTEGIDIDDIRKIVFVDTMGADEVLDGEPYIFPNPVRKSLCIGNIEQSQTISIYSIDGHLLRQFQANANESVDLGSLAAGMYILRVDEKNFKLMKL